MTNIPFNPAFSPSPDLLASVPVHVVALFDFSDWQSTHPTEPLPGVQVDACFAQTNDALNNVMDRLAMIQRDDGALLNGSVGLDQMDPELLAIIDSDVADAAAAAAAALAAQAAAEAAQVAAEAALAEATAATDAAEAAQAAAAASAAEAAASVAEVIPLVEDAQQAAADAAAAAAAVEGLIPDPSLADAMKVITVNAAGDDYELRPALVLLPSGKMDANGATIENISEPSNDNDAANKKYVDDAIVSAGSVPSPDPGDEGKVLTATSPGIFGWAAFVVAQISDATAFMKNLLTTVNNQAGLLAAAGAAPAAEGTPVPANPGDNGKVLTANAGAKVWTALPAAAGQATEAALGLVRIVDAVTIDAGADDQEAITAAKLAGSKFNVIGKQSFLIPASGWTPHPTEGPTVLTRVTAGYQIYRVLSYPDGITKSAGYTIPLPKKVNGAAGYAVRVRWSAASAGVGGTVRWLFDTRTVADGGSINGSWTASVAFNAAIAANVQDVSDEFVVAGAAPGKQDTLYCTLTRLGADAADTLASAAEIISVEVFFSVDKGTDA